MYFVHCCLPNLMIVEFMVYVFMQSVLYTAKSVCLIDIIKFVSGWWFSLSTPVSSINKTDHPNITEILLKVALTP